jgi:sigma-E factor negative regulatory protein RseA
MTNLQSGERELLSSFMDGEMEAARVDAVVRSCRTGAELRDDWMIYHCIGDVLRSDDMGGHSTRLASSVSARLAEEPFLMIVRRRPAAHFPMRRIASFAAALAGVAAVAFLALPRWNGPADRLAQGTAPASVTVAAPVALPAAVTAVAPLVSREFLAAHRQYSGGLAMQGVAGQLRNVALESNR